MPSVKDGDGTLVERLGQGKTELLGDSPDLVPLCPPQIPHGFLGPPLWEAGRNQGAAYSYASCLHVVFSNHCTSNTGLWHCREPDSWFSVYSIWTKQHSISEWFNPESAIKFVNKRLIAVIQFEWTGQIWVPLPSLKKDSWTQWTSHCLSVPKWIWLFRSFLPLLFTYILQTHGRWCIACYWSTGINGSVDTAVARMQLKKNLNSHPQAAALAAKRVLGNV
jgi:hypothetical protein